MLYLAEECRPINQGIDYQCDIGQSRNITFPRTLNTATGASSINIGRFILSCLPAYRVFPAPQFSWRKDGLTVVDSVQEGSFGRAMLNEVFFRLGNNSRLLQFTPHVPIMIDRDFSLVVDFFLDPAIWDIDAITRRFGRGQRYLRNIILEAVAGDWTCTATNAYGSDSKRASISRKSFLESSKQWTFVHNQT